MKIKINRRIQVYPIICILFLLSLVKVDLFAQGEKPINSTLTIIVEHGLAYCTPCQKLTISEFNSKTKVVYLIDENISAKAKRKIIESASQFTFIKGSLINRYDNSLLIGEIEKIKSKGWKLKSSNIAIGMGGGDNYTTQESLTYYIFEK